MSALYWSKSLSRKILARSGSPRRPKKSPVKAGKLSTAAFVKRFEDERLWVLRSAAGSHHRKKISPEQIASIDLAIGRWNTTVDVKDEAWVFYAYSQFSVGKMAHDKLMRSWVEVRGLAFALEALFTGLSLIRTHIGNEPDSKIIKQLHGLRAVTAHAPSPLPFPEALAERIETEPVLAIVAAFLDPEDIGRATRAWDVAEKAREKRQLGKSLMAMLLATQAPLAKVTAFIKGDPYAEASRVYLPSAIDIHGAALQDVVAGRVRYSDFFWYRKDLIGEAATAFVHLPGGMALLVEAIDGKRSPKPRKEIEACLLAHPALCREALRAALPAPRASALLEQLGG